MQICNKIKASAAVRLFYICNSPKIFLFWGNQHNNFNCFSYETIINPIDLFISLIRNKLQ